MSKWINFTLIERKSKTEVYEVETIQDKIILGYIKWYPQWRQYCFFSVKETVFANSCLQDIINFIQDLMLKRKQRLIDEKAFPKKEEN